MRKVLPLKGLFIGLGLLTLGLVYFFFNPMQYTFFPECPFYELTGLYCPGCGSQRAFHALLHGHLLQAAGFNLLAILFLPLIVYPAIVWTGNAFFHKKWKQKILYATWLPKAVLIAVVLFWLMRNLPIASFRWLAP